VCFVYGDRFALPELNDNHAEGVVIKPNVSAWFHSGSRVILKNKTERFTEKVTAKAPKDKTVRGHSHFFLIV
jgi:uncharacterized protein YlzI (FlbEa/FlbD family)